MANFKNYINESLMTVNNIESNEQILRFILQAELDAINLYQSLIKKTKDKNLITVINDIINEEKIHVEEINILLNTIDDYINISKNKAQQELNNIKKET